MLSQNMYICGCIETDTSNLDLDRPTDMTANYRYNILLLLLPALVLILYPAVSAGQKGKKSEPECLGSERVCNAVIQFPDKVIDQGRYCNGCINCSAPVDLRAGNSFLWQHFEYARMRVQFLKCTDFRQVHSCRPSEVKAAVFVSPRNSWEPALEQIYCRCPPAPTDGANGAPLFYLLGWHLEAEQWVYEFGCKLCQCSSAESPGTQTQSDNKLIGGTCARKRKRTEDGPVDVKFACACPAGYHCYVSDQDNVAKEQQASGDAGGESGSAGEDVGGGDGGSGGGGVSGAGGGGASWEQTDLNTDWRQVRDEVTGGYIFEKRVLCEKRLMNQTASSS
ncbi:hypothetical protein BOX15_Mlig033031g1 [Macrostomum lignano]|uniref:Uncharacterized protein n=1 Tax=Macrostomum lignano TaxID=282301 RepID=A0A267H3X0_9PLAT|nr:hypothetical protein BOX15_Mlig033031g1 [Macrostomum lignano]